MKKALNCISVLFMMLLFLFSGSIDTYAQEQLSPEKDMELKKDYQTYIGEEYVELEDISYDYYGNYHGIDIVMMYDHMPAPDIGCDLQLGNYVFQFGWVRDAMSLYAYQDHDFIWIVDAYYSNLLTSQDLDLLVEMMASTRVSVLENEYGLAELNEFNVLNNYRSFLKQAGIEATDIKYECYGVFDIYYGEVLLFDYAEAKDDGVSTELTIGDYTFVFGSTELSERFYYHSDNGLISLAEAYELELLTDANLEYLAQRMKNAEFDVSVYKTYKDVKSADWFYEATDVLYEKGIMTGMKDGQFSPYENISRAQLVTILYRMHGSPEMYMNPYSDIFGDITEVEFIGWYGDALWWAWESEIVAGYENGCFGPADSITREQLCVMLYRYANGIGMDVKDSGDISSFEDADKISGFALEAIKWAAGEGILTGKEDSTRIDPQGTATRAEAAVMMHRFDLMEKVTVHDYKLIVDDVDITEISQVKFHRLPEYVLLPFEAVLETLGADFSWSDENTAEMMFNGKTYIFDRKEISLIAIEDEYGFNLIKPLAGGVLRYEVTDDQLLLDDNTFFWIIEEMGTDIHIDVDYEDYIVNIINQEVDYDYQLIVEDQNISKEAYVKVYKKQDYVLIPFVSVMEALGAEVNWTSETFAEITFKEMKCSYDSETMEIVDMNSGRQFLPYYDADSHSQIIGRELFWDVESFRNTLECLDIFLKIDVDHKNQKITVEYLADDADPVDYKLIVNGQDITDGNYLEVHKNEKYTLLPVTAVLESLGAEVNWTNETIADIIFNERVYVLDLEKISLVEKDDKYAIDYLIPAPGGEMYCRVIDGELLLDDLTFKGSVMQMGMETMVRVNVDHENHIIEIAKEETDSYYQFSTF